MKTKLVIIVAAALLLLVGIVVFWFGQPLNLLGHAVLARSFGSASKGSASLPPKPPIPVPEQIDSIRAEIEAAKDPATVRALLNQLRDLLNSLPPAAASREVQSYLATGKDASTKLDLTLKPGGILADSSSLRVFLLDYLGLVDRAAGGRVATQILSSYSTPDEWAVSMRNYAWAYPGPAGADFLKLKAQAMLANPDWLKDPSAGFLEAFDTIVYTNDTALTPTLSMLMRDKDNRAAAHAAFLTMDRLVINDPAPMLKSIVTQPDLMAGHEQTRADFVARADLGQADQRALVEQYLLDPTHNSQELATFAAIFPNANYMVSDNLLTPVQTPTGPSSPNVIGRPWPPSSNGSKIPASRRSSPCSPKCTNGSPRLFSKPRATVHESQILSATKHLRRFS